MKYLIVGVIFVLLFVGCSGGDKAAGPIMNVSFEEPGIAGIRGVLGQQWKVENWVITTECDDNVVMTVTESPFCLIGKDLRNCKARPVSFVLSGATYTYSGGFSAYGVGEFGIYVNADDSTDRKRIQVISQIPNPITARFDVKFLLSHVASGGKLFGSLIGATGSPTIGSAPVMALNMVDMNYVGVANGLLSFSLPVRCDQWTVANDSGHLCERVRLEGLYFKVADFVPGTVVDTAYLDSVLVGAPTLSDGAYSGKVVFVTSDEGAGEHGGFNFTAEFPNCFEGRTDGCPTGTSHSHIVVAKYDHGNGGISYIYWTVEISIKAPSSEIVPRERKLVASSGAIEDQFGFSVSIFGDRIVVGAPGDDDKGENSGSAYVYKFNGESWLEEKKIVAPDGAAGDRFGFNVSMFGDRIVVGAPHDRTISDNYGVVYIYKVTSAGWVLEYRSDKFYSGRFGYSVSLSGDRLAVGRPGASDGRNEALLFDLTRLGDPFKWQGAAYRDAGSGGSEFGASVSVDGGWTIVGDPSNNERASIAGGAYVYSTGLMESTPSVYLIGAKDAKSWDRFGSSVSISGTRLIIGAPGDDDDRGEDCGSAYLFSVGGNGWFEEVKLVAFDGSSDDYFGSSVSLSGNRIAVGAKMADGKAEKSGSVYIYNFNGVSWFQKEKLVASDGEPGDQFGQSVSISGDRIVVGAHGKVKASGAVYVFEQ